MIKISISLDQELNLALHAEAINQDVSKSEVVRLALRRYLGMEPEIVIIDS